ncbi:hypothetical protein Tco_0337763 [Tanacetum coccineum]
MSLLRFSCSDVHFPCCITESRLPVQPVYLTFSLAPQLKCPPDYHNPVPAPLILGEFILITRLVYDMFEGSGSYVGAEEYNFFPLIHKACDEEQLQPWRLLNKCHKLCHSGCFDKKWTFP